MGQVPYIVFEGDKAIISCYGRKIVISKSKYDSPLIELVEEDDELDREVTVEYWVFKNDPDFDIFWELIEGECDR